MFLLIDRLGLHVQMWLLQCTQRGALGDFSWHSNERTDGDKQLDDRGGLLRSLQDP